MAVTIAAVIAPLPNNDDEEDTKSKGQSCEADLETKESTMAWEEGDLELPADVSEKIISTMTKRQKVHAILDATGFQEEHYADRNRILRNIALIISFSLIIFSVIIFTLDSLPAYYRRDLLSFFVSEAVCIGWFTIELFTRAVTCSDMPSFSKSPMNWIDLVAIFPFYMDIVVRFTGSSGASNANGLVLLRVIRLTRAFRVFKLSKYNEGVQIVVAAVVRSQDALSLLAFLMMIATVLFGSSMFYAEQGAADFSETERRWIRREAYGGDAVQHPFKSIPHAFWWCLVTVTSVGYGDMYPVTLPGYLVGCGTMMTGMLLVAFPIIILGANFTEARIEYFKDKELDLQFRRYQRRYLVEHLRGPMSTEDILQVIDTIPPIPEVMEIIGPNIDSDDVTDLIALLSSRLESLEQKMENCQQEKKDLRSSGFKYIDNTST